MLDSGRLDLGKSRGAEVDTALLSKADQVDQNIGQFFAHTSMERLRGDQLFRAVSRKPLQQLGQLPHLTDEGKEHGLRVLELLPVALLAKLTSGYPDGFEI